MGVGRGLLADRDSLYAGVAGLAPVLVEVAEARPWTDAEHRLRDGVVDRLSAMVATRSEPSLYDGLAGDATALRMLSPTAAPHALRRLEELERPRRLGDDVRGRRGSWLAVSTTW